MVDLDDFPVEVRMRFIAAQVYAATDLGMWCFGLERQLYYSTCPNEKEILNIMKLSDCLDFMYEKEEGWNCPVVLSDQLGLVWIAEHIYKEEIPSMLIVMGPVFLSQTSLKSIEDALGRRDVSIEMKKQMARVLATVPVMTISNFQQYGKMLHYSITGERMQGKEFIYQGNSEERRQDQKWHIEEDGAMYTAADRNTRGEEILLQAVSDGNLNYKQIMNESLGTDGSLVSDTGEALRDGKNTVHVFNALCYRAALKGGISALAAKEIEQRYYKEAEKCTTITKLAAVNEKMLDEYVHKVHDNKENEMISRPIREACDYIRANVQKNITAESVAVEIGYSAYYFTKKFHQEMGVRVSDYIKQVRIEHAKIALISTKKSIQEISDFLQFGTRNYFTKVFREIVGMTPAEYRESSGGERNDI